jgi:hypothetical protein
MKTALGGFGCLLHHHFINFYIRLPEMIGLSWRSDKNTRPEAVIFIFFIEIQPILDLLRTKEFQHFHLTYKYIHIYINECSWTL